MTLNEREAFWTEQLPIFKENYICLAQLDAVQFNSETGSFDVLDKDATGFDQEDILEAYHSVNTGWAMWLRAKSQEKAKAQAVPEGYCLVPKEIPDSVVSCLENSRFHWGDGTRDYYTPIYSLMVEAACESGAEG